MKILIVSMHSLHTLRWVSQLKDSGHEVHYFDILNGGYIEQWDWVEQHTDWRFKFGNFKGRFLIKKYFPKLHRLLENDVEREFERLLKMIKPDVVHSFVMYKCCVPIFPVMKKHPEIKWIYSSWGSDLFYFKTIPNYLEDIKNVLPHVDYLFTDTIRDHKIARNLGFKNTFLGKFPGGGGFHLEGLKNLIQPFPQRNIILVKGYQGRSGRGIFILRALLEIEDQLKDYEIIVFGASKEFITFLKKVKLPENFKIYTKISHKEVLQLMGQSLLYIGNSNSDGMPNTLLEAIIMGAFPIQSNPGSATAEIIENGTNGLLIQDPENVENIKTLILTALSSKTMLQKAFLYNQELKMELDYEKIKNDVLAAYAKVEKTVTTC